MAQSMHALSRISMSLPAQTLTAIDRFIEQRGFPNRSHAIALMLNQYITEHRENSGDEVVAGTMTLLYNQAFDVQSTLSRIRRQHTAEVISATNVQLENGHTLEVILMQGRGTALNSIGEQVMRLRGVIYARMQLLHAKLPVLS